MRRGRYAGAEAHRWMTAAEIGAEIDMTAPQVKRMLRRHSWLRIPTRTSGRVRLYDASYVEVLKAVRAHPHRPVDPPGKDWLTQWIGDHHA